MPVKEQQRVLDDEASGLAFVRAATDLARAQVPPGIAAAIGLGRIVALQKPNGRVRGIVVGDFLRRLVARSLAQIFSSNLQEACQPFQFSLSTRAGTEALAHALQAATAADPDATILSVDGVGAYDAVSRLAMLRGLSRVPGAGACFPFVRQFYTAPSRFVWHDAAGRPHAIDQAEGGEQGDPLMPALYALGQHPALVELQRHLRPGELVFAYLDDIYAIVPSARARVVFDQLSQHLFRHARIEVHQGKTRAWNAAGLEPPGIRELGSTDAPVWVGDPALPPEQQGLVASHTRQAGLASSRHPLAARPSVRMVAASVLCFPALLSPSAVLATCGFARLCGICWGPARSRTTRSALPSSLSSKVA